MHRRKVIQHISFRGAAPNPAGGASAHPRTPSLTFIVSPGCQPIISPAVRKNSIWAPWPRVIYSYLNDNLTVLPV